MKTAVARLGEVTLGQRVCVLASSSPATAREEVLTLSSKALDLTWTVKDG